MASKTGSESPKTQKQSQLVEILVQSVKDYAIFALDTDGQVTTWNEGAKHLLGWTENEILGLKSDLFYVESERLREVPEGDLQRSINEGRLEYDCWRIRKDGTRLWASWLVTPLFDAQHSFIGYAVIVRDLTERRAAAETLRQSDEAFRLMVASVKDYAIFLLDPTGHVLTWNLGAQRIKGYREEEIIGKHFEIFYPNDARNIKHPAFELKTASEKGHYQEEGWRVRKDGTQFWASVTITPVYNEEGLLRGFIKVTRDMTESRNTEIEREKVREQAVKASELKSQFVANVSHEIRTPMAGIIGMAEELVMDNALGDTQKKAAEELYQSSLRLLRVLNDILDFSKLEAGKIVPEIAPMCIETAIEEVLKITASVASKKGITITTHIDPALPNSIKSDESRVRQILLNLTHNATKFTQAGSITISVTLEPDNMVKFVVTDTGIGIPEGAKSKLFQPFVQVDGTTRRKYGGTGLGLSIAKRYVELLNGTIGCDSKEDVGSAFWFTIPMELK